LLTIYNISVLLKRVRGGNHPRRFVVVSLGNVFKGPSLLLEIFKVRLLRGDLLLGHYKKRAVGVPLRNLNLDSGEDRWLNDLFKVCIGPLAESDGLEETLDKGKFYKLGLLEGGGLRGLRNIRGGG